MPQMTGGQAVVAALRAEGIDTVFGIVGTHNAPLFDALYDCPDVRLVTPRHEQGAAMMADGYARASGRVAACFTVPGPGFTNTLTGLGQAYSDSSPLVLVAAQIDSRRVDRDLEDFHELRRSLEVASAATGYAARASRVEDIPAVVQAAVRSTRSGRPRPAYVEVPMDVLAARGVAEPLPSVALSAPAASPEAVQRAATLLREARRPLLYVGGGALKAGASAEVLEVALRLQAPVLSSLHGKGVVPDDHPLGLGDGWRQLPLLSEVLRQADVALAIGARFDGVSDPSQGRSLPEALVHLDIDPRVIGRHRPATVGLVGDARQVLRQLLQALGPGEGPGRCWLDTAQARAERRRYLEERAGPVLHLLDELRAALPRETIVCNDLNLVSYWAQVALEVYEPRTYLHPGSYGSLGFALPAAIGAKIARPERPVVALCGDGGFMFTCQELAVAAQERLDLVVVVFKDGAYGALKVLQDRKLGGRRIGVELGSPDFPALARALGARGWGLDSPGALAPALREALALPGPTLLEVPLAIEGRAAIPPWMAE
ncbi:MAG: thiamine pyrophosphate-binding protein [Chloroflexi bacterium]|nr:thiamine pyrophosphate-binding protein [Chloroflexota bacterium]